MDGVRIFFNLTILRDNGPIICPWFTDERSILRINLAHVPNLSKV